MIAKKWGWYIVVHTLAAGDPLKIEAATQLEIEMAFTYLSYEQDKRLKDKAPDANQFR